MTRSYRIYRIAAIIAACLIVLGLSTSTGRDRKTYEIDTQAYSVPGYQSDASRAINAYERLMERHMDLTERNLMDLAADLKVLTTKIDAADGRLAQLDQRLARIEKHLGIAPVPPPAPVRPDPNAPTARPAGTPLAIPQ